MLAILVGLPKHRAAASAHSTARHAGFHGDLDDAQVAELASFMRATMGGLPADVTASQVAQLRGAATKAGHGPAP